MLVISHHAARGETRPPGCVGCSRRYQSRRRAGIGSAVDARPESSFSDPLADGFGLALDDATQQASESDNALSWVGTE